MRTVLMIFVASVVSAAGAENRHPSQVAGIYEGAIPVKGADARKLTLTLNQDGSADFRDASKKTSGQWEVEGQNLQITLQGMTDPLKWRVKGNLLTPKDWDRTVYGKKGPVLRRPR